MLPRQLDHRFHVVLLGMVVVFFGLAGCGASQTTTETAKEVTPSLPPLPSTPLDAVLPVEGPSVVVIDMQGLRGSPVMERMERALAESCFAASDVQSLFLNMHGLAFASSDDASDAGFALAVQGAESQVTSARLLSTVGRYGYGMAGTPTDVAAVGRLHPKALGALRAAELSPGLVLVADEHTFAKLAANYDDPERGTPKAPADLSPEKGQMQLWTADGRAWVEPSGVVPGDIVTPLTGAATAMSFRSDADGFHVQVLTRLRDEAAAKTLLANVHSRLSSAALVMRLMGLPDLSKRIEKRQDGALVDISLHLTRDESGRLLTLGQMEAQSRLEVQCERAEASPQPTARNQ